MLCIELQTVKAKWIKYQIKKYSYTCLNQTRDFKVNIIAIVNTERNKTNGEKSQKFTRVINDAQLYPTNKLTLKYIINVVISWLIQ